MKRSLPAFRFINVFKSVFPLLRILILFLLIICPETNAQDVFNSVGPAPISEMKISAQETTPFAVGTRAFLQLSISPNVQFAKSFMESCSVTYIGGPFPLTSIGGLVFVSGKVYTWNQSSPYQFWQVDTVTGVNTLIFNITGVPLAALTGICWDGSSLFGVATNSLSSWIFRLNAVTGVCTLIGTPSAACSYAVFIEGRQFAWSSLFSPDAVTDNIYRWNKTTGTATLIGPAGFNVTIGEDASFDGNICYWVADSSLRKWDTTGNISVLCNYSTGAKGIACVTYPPPLGVIHLFEVPITYILSQNYPNPFNPVTTIKYGLPKFGKTSLIVYDILGRVVTKLVDNEFKDAGTYEVQWDASNFSSGIYLYTLESGSYKETKKMVVIK